MTRSSHYICDCLFTNAHGTDYIAEKLAIHFDYFLVSILGFAHDQYYSFFLPPVKGWLWANGVKISVYHGMSWKLKYMIICTPQICVG